MTTSHDRAVKIASLVSSLASKDGVVRERARHALVALGRPAAGALTKALSDPRDQVRWEAAKGFEEAPDPSSAPALIAALEDEVSGIRWLAGKALAALGTGALDLLMQALIDKPRSYRLHEGARHVLTAEPGRKLRHILAPVLDALEDLDPESAVPVAARQALSRLREPDR